MPDEFSANTQTTGFVDVNGQVTSAIDSDGDVDWIASQLTANSTYEIKLGGVSSGGGLLQDPVINGIYDALGVLLPNTTNDDYPGLGYDSFVSFTPTTNGLYYIAARGYGGSTGTYTLSVDSNSAPPPPSTLPSLSITPLDVPAAEGSDGGSTFYTFNVNRTGDLMRTSGATWSVAGDVDASDFVGGVIPTGTVVFYPGQSVATVSVEVLADTVEEGDEGFTVTLSNPLEAVLGTSSVTTSLNDSSSGGYGVTENFYTLAAGGGTFTLSYDMYGIPDLAEIYVNGSLAVSTPGEVSYTGTLTILQPLNGGDQVRVVMTGDDQGTLWEYSIDYQGGMQALDYIAAGTIVNDDWTQVPTDPMLSMTPPVLDQLEGNSTAGFVPMTFTVTRTGDLSSWSSAHWQLTGTGADPVDVNDFVNDFVSSDLPWGWVDFAPGQETATVNVEVLGDTVPEPDETFVITLSDPIGAWIDPMTETVSGTVLNDDTQGPTIQPILSLSPLTPSMIAEGNGGTTPIAFTVTRTGDLTGTSSISWSVSGNGANQADPTDFVGGLSGILDFAAGQASASATVEIKGDTTIENDEGFIIALANPVSARLGTSSVVAGVIVNDEASLPTLSLSPLNPSSITEGNSGMTAVNIIVTRDGDTAGYSSASLTIAGSGLHPADADDFLNGVLAGAVIFAPGETTATATFNVSGDTTIETNETFTVTLSDFDGALPGDVLMTAGTITNDDAAPAGDRKSVAGTVDDDYIVLSAGNNYRGSLGNDTYLVSPHTLIGNVTARIQDTQGNNVIQFVDGMTFESGEFYSDQVTLHLDTGATVEINSADEFTYQVGANALEGDAGITLDYAGFAALLGIPSLPIGSDVGDIERMPAPFNNSIVDLSSGTVTADRNNPEEFRFDFQIVNGVVTTADDDEVTINGFDVWRDKLVFVNTTNQNIYTEAQFMALDGVDITSSQTTNSMTISLAPSNNGSFGGITLLGIQDIGLSQVMLETMAA